MFPLADNAGLRSYRRVRIRPLLMKICPICAERYPDDVARCRAHPDRALLRLGDFDGDPLVGQLLDGRYLLLERLGEGGMGTVYKAWQQRVNRIVAVKTIRGDRATAAMRERFVREAEVTAGLTSPHTITVYDSGELDDGTLYLVMEFLNGRALDDVVEEDGHLDLPRLKRLALQLCDSLAEAHGRDLVHRDIKPANLVVSTRPSGEEILTVLDFGVVKLPDLAANKLTREGMTVGSLSYMSPEQIDGRQVDATSDIYSVGITLYQLASGVLPFTGETALAVMFKHLSEAPPHLTTRLGASPAVAALDAVVQRCLKKRPSERFPSVSALREALEQIPIEARSAAVGLTRPPPRTRQSLRVRVDGDPAQIPGVTVAQVHRRVTETRLASNDDPAAVDERDHGRQRRIRLAAIAIAVVFGLYIVLDGILGG
ncbi:MAG: serine/threonine protein kinase [Deltaproteobacteria bacterium]|nr:MAG: serine/threonine protein kinase [Deltaproteobacteria bacterium]